MSDRPSARNVAKMILQFYCMEESEYGGVLHCAVNEGNLDNGSLHQTRGWITNPQKGASPEFDAFLPPRAPRHWEEGDPQLALAIVDALLAMRMTARKKAINLASEMWCEVETLVYRGRKEPRFGTRDALAGFSIPGPARDINDGETFRIISIRSSQTFQAITKFYPFTKDPS